MKCLLKGLFFGWIFLLSGLFSREFVFAQNNQSGLTVSPAFQEILLRQSDQETHFTVSLKNDTEVSTTLGLTVYDFGSLDESGGVAFLGASSDLAKKYALASWMIPETERVTLAPGETGLVSVRIKNDETLSPGGHYGALMFQVEDTTGVHGSVADNVSVKQMFSTLVFMKKVGGEVYGLALDEQQFNDSLFGLDESVVLPFRNDGNVHVVPRGVVSIRDPLGRMVAKGAINEETSIILPETKRNYKVKLSDQATAFIPGKYTLQTVYRYDGKDDFSTLATSFYSIPPLSFVGAFVVTGSFIVWYVIRRRRRRSRGSSKESNV